MESIVMVCVTHDFGNDMRSDNDGGGVSAKRNGSDVCDGCGNIGSGGGSIGGS